MLDFLHSAIVFVGGFFAGAVNAIAGGGTLISFPILTAVGIPAVSANVTSTISLSPGYLSATLAQIKDLKSQKNRMTLYLVTAAIGGIVGGVLLLFSGDKLFSSLIPYLILLASSLLAFQEKIKKVLAKKQDKSQSVVWMLIALFFAAIYGGYFGAGLSVIVLAVLSLTLNENLTKLNALKQVIGFAVNMSTALFFIFSGKAVWTAVFIMATGAIAGGWAGGKMAGKIKPLTLRYIVVSIGYVVSVIYFIKQL